MPQGQLLFEIFLRGLTVGLALAAAAAFLRGRVSWDIRVSAVLACLSAASYWTTVSGLAPFAGSPFPGFEAVLRLAGAGVIGFVWLFLVVIFDDRRLRLVTLAPALVLMGLYLLELAPGRVAAYYGVEIFDFLYFATLAMGGLLAAHAIFVIIRGWRGDLLEARRRLRGPITAVSLAMSLYLIWLVFAELIGVIGRAPASIQRFDIAAETLISLAAIAVLLEARSSLFGQAAQPRLAEGRAETEDQRAMQKLQALMERDEAWRREGLGIAALAGEIGVSEQRLRRLINRRLGHRNFAAFLNAYRIEAAKTRLTDSGNSTVAAIAFDLGYASLGPFNRAFKQAVGQTPTEWRKTREERVS